METQHKVRRRSLCYSLDETVLINIETDAQFLQDIREIAEKRQMLGHPEFKEKVEITDAQFDEIDEKARKHTEANIFNKTSVYEFKKIDNSAACNCGCNRGEGQYFPLCFNQQNLSFLGPGALLFFFYLRHVRLLVGTIFIIYGMFALASNMVGSQNRQFDCSESLGYSYIFCIFNQRSTFVNKINSPILMTVQLWLGFIAILVWSIGIKVLNYLGEENNKKIDMLLDSASDYTIRIENLPYGEYHQEQLIQFLNQLWLESTESNEPDLRLKSIQIVYNTSKCRELISKILQQSGELLKLLKATTYRFSNTIIEDNVNHYRTKKRALVTKLRELEQMRFNFLNNTQFRKSMATTCALLQFTSTAQQTSFIQKFGTKKNPIQQAILPNRKLSFKGNNLIITRAPQPSDLLWLNCEKNTGYMTYISIWIMTGVILAIGYGSISLLLSWNIFKGINTTVVAIALQLFNRAIWLALGYLVTYEENNTKTDAIVSLMKRSVIAQAINVTATPMILTFINSKGLYGNSGLSGIVLDYHIAMFVVMLLYYVLNPFYLGKRILLHFKFSRNRIIRSLCEVVQKLESYEQIQNVLVFYEGPQFPVAGGYVYMTTAIFHAMFYCHLQPFILLVVAVNMTCFFYNMKYMLLRRCKIPELTDIQVFNYAIFAMSCAPLFYGAGSLFFLIKDNKTNQYLIASILCIVVWLIAIINPFSLPQKVMQLILNYINAQPQQTERPHMKAQSVGQSIFFNSDFFKNKFWRRRECYYRFCNTGKLLDFERQLKDRDLDKKIQVFSVRNYSESFFKSEIIFDTDPNADITLDTILSNIKPFQLIPIDVVSTAQ